MVVGGGGGGGSSGGDDDDDVYVSVSVSMLVNQHNYL